MTILSVNKTMEDRWAHFLRPFLMHMKNSVKNLVYGAMIGALYVILTLLQNTLLPGTASMAIQFRASEALCVLALFTSAAVPGLTVGCFLFNLTQVGVLPLDMLLGSLATFLACGAMYLTRKVTVRSFPLLGLLMPAIFNGLIIGAEVAVITGTPFWMNGAYVAIGEAAVLFTLGTALYYALRANGLAARIF